MICRKCKRKPFQVSGHWTPEKPNITTRKYVCWNCRIGYTEVVDTKTYEVISVEETDLDRTVEKQSSLKDWM